MESPSVRPIHVSERNSPGPSPAPPLEPTYRPSAVYRRSSADPPSAITIEPSDKRTAPATRCSSSPSALSPAPIRSSSGPMRHFSPGRQTGALFWTIWIPALSRTIPGIAISPFAHPEIRTTAVADLAPIIKVGASCHVVQHLARLITSPRDTGGGDQVSTSGPETWNGGQACARPSESAAILSLSNHYGLRNRISSLPASGQSCAKAGCGGRPWRGGALSAAIMHTLSGQL